MPTDSLILKHYTIGDEGFRYCSREGASASILYTEGREIVEHVHEYRVGDEVEVHAYGAWRPGKVVGLKRLRVLVHYERNKRGDMFAKAFHGAEVRPRGEGQWVQS